MLITVKQLADDSSLTGVSDWWRSIVTDRLVRWAVEGYYRIDLGGPAADDGSRAVSGRGAPRRRALGATRD